MSYSYSYPEAYSTTPTTPGSAQPYPWEQQQQSQQQQALVPPPSSTSPVSAYPQQPQTIHLHERAPLPSVPAYGGAVGSEHAMQARLPVIDERDELLLGGGSMPPARTARPASAPGPSGGGPIRRPPSRASTREASHPYRRPSAAATEVPAMTRATSAGGELPAHHTRVRSAAQEAFRVVGTPVSIPCPGQAQRREEQERARPSVASAPAQAQAQGATPRAQVPGPRRFIIRADVHFDERQRRMTAMLELPGLKKSDVRLTVAMCPYTRVRQLTISGKSRPVWAEDAQGFTVRERKFGDFSRIVAIPPDTRVDTIHAEMKDGLLTVQIPIASPLPREDPAVVPIL